MNALILAGGYGNRLGKITKKIPKCLIKINGIVILDLWIKKLENAGIKKIYINTHYLSNKVEKHIKSNQYNSEINLLYEENLLGTAGTLKKNINLFKNSDLFFIHCDNYCEEDLKYLLSNHKNKPKNCGITMMTFMSNEPENCGVLEVNQKNIIIKYEEKPKNPFSNLSNSAIMIISKNYLSKIVELISTRNNADDFCKDILPLVFNECFTYQTKKSFIDIGTKKNLDKAIMINSNSNYNP